MAEPKAFVDEFESNVLNYHFGLIADTYTRGATLFLGLWTSDVLETDDGTSVNELQTTFGYARQPISFGTASTSGSGKQIANITADTVFQASGGAWSAVVGVAILDVVTDGAGKILAFDNSISSATLADGDTLTFAVGNVIVSIDIT